MVLKNETNEIAIKHIKAPKMEILARERSFFSIFLNRKKKPDMPIKASTPAEEKLATKGSRIIAQ
jgi:hypothetical protein